MSFKEIKSLLRMVNVDMNDMYAYRLFKVGSCRTLTFESPSFVDRVASPSGKAPSGPS